MKTGIKQRHKLQICLVTDGTFSGGNITVGNQRTSYQQDDYVCMHS